MRILFVTQYYDPEGPLPTQLAKGLVAEGHSVEVLTAFPHYQQGRIHGGYRMRPWLREELDGVRVTRVPLYPSHDRSAVRRSATYLSFALSAAVLGRFLTKRPDVMYVYHPPATTGLAALALRALRRRIPILYHIQDLWPEAVGAVGMVPSSAAMRTIDRLSYAVYRRVDRILAISPGFKARLVERGIDPDKVEVLYNWCHDEEALVPRARDRGLAERLGLADRWNVVYAGSMGTVQGLDTVLDAAKLASASLPDVQFVLVGDGTETARLCSRVVDEGIPNVKLLPRCSFDEVAAIMAWASAALVHLDQDPVFRMWIPGKTQAYMAMGRPLLMGVEGDASDLVRSAEAGLHFTPSDPRSLAEALRSLRAVSSVELEQMGRNARAYYEDNLSFATALSRVSGAMRALAGVRR